MSNPDEALAPFSDLIEQWERREKTARKLASDAAGAGDWTTLQRCETKAGVIRSMTQELKREIQNQPKAEEWMPIETAPKWTNVLVWRKDAGVFVAKVATPECVMTEHQLEVTPFPDGFEEWWSDAWGWLEGEMKPTHWRPLPSQPKNADVLASADEKTTPKETTL